MKLRKVKNKNLALFLLVCSSTAILLIVGLAIGYFVGGTATFIGAMIGGVLGAIIGTEISYRNGLVEAEWDRLLWGMPQMGLFIAGLGAIMSGFAGLVASVMAILGAGVGALLAKYLLRFLFTRNRLKYFRNYG